MSPCVWLITGTSSGFGRNMTEYLLQKGQIVVATARKPEVLDDLKAKYSASQFITVGLDVDKAQDIKEAFATAKQTFGRIDVVFSNAGWFTFAEVEAHPEDQARKMFDTNFWGSANVSREAVRFFREENKPCGGRLLVNSSMTGIRATAGMAYYSASKHALEGVTEALAQELDPNWNIKISLVEPGAFYTEAIKKSGAGTIASFFHPAYSSPSLPTNLVRGFIGSGARMGSDPAKAVQRIYDLSLLPNPPMRLLLGKDSVGGVKAQVRKIEEDANNYEKWSEGLEFDA